MRIAIHAPPAETAIIRELLSPWCVSYTNSDQAEISIAYATKPAQSTKTIIIPSCSPSLDGPTKDSKPKLSRINRKRIRISIDPNSVLEITPETLYCPCEPGEKASIIDLPTTMELDNSLLLSIDLVTEYKNIIDRIITAKSSFSFRLLTGLPFPYSIIPQGVRELFLKKHVSEKSFALNDKLSIDAYRFILSKAIERITNRKMRKKTWNGKRYAFLLTHDVETREGLLKARRLKKLENKYDVQSTWFIPSKRYRLNSQTIQELANHGEVGSHDTKHDGKLATLPKQTLVQRLSEAKATLEEVTHQSVSGFRAPLLQYSANIIEALRESDYAYDSSIPTWEPKHPSTMTSHGIETVYPLTINGLTEIPITLPQDHQLLYVLGLNPKEIIDQWLKAACLIKSLGGLCTFLVHPDYKFANHRMEIYEELLNAFISDQASITLPREIADNLKTI